MTELSTAQKIMGKNFIGPKELEKIGLDLKIKKLSEIKLPMPRIKYSTEFLAKVKNSHILILGISCDFKGKPLTINRMRQNFGTDPKKSEPCFYNQDWYLKEDFAAKKTLNFDWYLISKKIKEKTRGINPEKIPLLLTEKESLPLAILAAFTFFAYYFLTKEKLWEKEFIWCKDVDSNGDQIYVGRYTDPKNINKNGFNIHRHLKIRSWFGAAPQIL